jgi:hypothetical protein
MFQNNGRILPEPAIAEAQLMTRSPPTSQFLCSQRSS